MENRIDFRTSHNIVINYPVATVFTRIGAFFIDTMIVIFAIIILSIWGQWLGVFYDLLIILILFFYHLAFEVYNHGQSPGKKLFGIKVVDMKGKTASMSQYAIRWAFRLVDIMISLGSLAVISTYSSSAGQRLGDVLAGTCVISTRDNKEFSFKNMEKLNQISTEKMDPALAQYEDEEMLIIKTLLNRYKSYPTSYNAQKLAAVEKKIKMDLKDTSNLDSVKYLEKVLNDYIVLTR
jgi:uncharacterized RDD family membrane protein YckC